jgi:hypothetical protein
MTLSEPSNNTVNSSSLDSNKSSPIYSYDTNITLPITSNISELNDTNSVNNSVQSNITTNQTQIVVNATQE